MSAVSDAVRRFNLEDYCERHGADLVASDEYLLTCPRCTKRKLTVNIKRCAWHCWTCDAGTGTKGRGGLIDLMQLLDGVTQKTAVERILLGARQIELSLEYVTAELTDQVVDSYVPARPIQPPFPSENITGLLPYMERRGITLEDAKQFGLFVCTGGRYGGRLVFPVWEDGCFVYWQARAMWDAPEHPFYARHPDDKYIKSLNPPRAEGVAVSSDVLMNLDQARRFERVAIVEGPIDCVKAGPSAVCTFGKKISTQQIAKLVRAGVKAVDLMWDGPSPREPEGAWREMQVIAPTLAAFFDVRLVRLPSGDPGERSRQELDWFRERAESYENHSSYAYL